VCVKAEKEGVLKACATVAANPRTCSQTVVGKPMLAIDKSGPESAQIGADVSYSVVVANKGSSIAKNVVVTDEVPAGMTHASGQKTLSWNLGDMAPGATRTIPVVLRASQTGKWCNNAIAASSNAGKVSDDACTTVVKPGIRIAKTGDKEQFIGRTAKYEVEVENIGDTTLTGVTVTDTAPSPTTIVTADGAVIRGNTATWTVGTLAPKEKKTFPVVLSSKIAGNYCNGAAVATAQGLRDSAQSCTLWKGIAAILLEVVDDPDPVPVGTSTLYTIRVTNQGNADLHNISTLAEYENEVVPVSTQQGKVEGQKVTFPVVPVLAPKASFTYTITVRGAKAADTRNKITIKCDETSRPVVEEESTTVY
jgi:uncharacterized repeat protein (TIGR01451 family)